MTGLTEATALLEGFQSGSLREAVRKLEQRLAGLTKAEAPDRLGQLGVSMELLLAALLIKKQAGQINEIVHAIGILLALPHILEDGEVVEGLSLAAGNTGKDFDLETNKRIAEFTFIRWQGGPEVMRQNKIFKDFFFLAEAETDKRRELYVVGTIHPSKFFESKRALPQILKGNSKLGKAFLEKYPTGMETVRAYYLPRKHLVAIRDLGEIIPALRQ
ncbi:MAG TPA: hypothetical protein VIW80_04300 [Pyrinomonadaceae bacterium]|jgi:hypothetical protein